MLISPISFARFITFCALLSPLAVHAGRYPGSGTQSFNYAVGATSLGDGTTISSNTGVASIQNNPGFGTGLQLTADGTGGTIAAFKLPDLDPGSEASAFNATFRVTMTAAGTPADGWSFNVGPITAGEGTGEGGFVMPGGLVVAFDTYDNGADTPSIEVFANGVSIGNFPQTFTFDTTARLLVVNWDSDGLDITWNGSAICTNLATPGFAPMPAYTFAFSGRTGGATQTTTLDDMVITTTAVAPLETGGPVISEFMAENKNILEDEDSETSDWVEIYNGQNTAATLTGWKLTNVAGGAGWVIPTITIPAYNFKVIFCSAKNRTDIAKPLHTDFTLEKSGGYVGLVRPDTTAASAFTYGNQFEDVAYGVKGPPATYGFLATPTPGTKNTGAQAPNGPAEDVVFLRVGTPNTPTDGGIFSATFSTTFQAPVAAGAVIRYTTNNTAPTEASPQWTPGTNFSISATSTYRARVYLPNALPGDVASRTWLRIDSSLTNYNGFGQPFSSHLPIVVLDSFGVPVDSYTDPGQPRPYRLSYAVVLDRDPLAANRALITGKVDVQGRCGTHVRGESSSGFPQKSYSWEFWDNEDHDKDVSVLGQPADSDWVLHGPYTDKTLMRNYTVYQSMRDLRGDGSAMRTRFVEVFFNQQAGQPVSYSDYRGIYVLVEKIKRGKDRVDIAKLSDLATDPAIISGGYIFKHDKPGIGNSALGTPGGGGYPGVGIQGVEPEVWNAAQQSYLQSHLNEFEAALYGSSFTSPTAGYAAYIDVDSFIDNQWWVEITKQIDGYRISQFFSKDRGAKIQALPLWDYNLSLSNADYLDGWNAAGWYYTQLNNYDYYWYPRLHQDPGYVRRHWDRYWELRRSIWTTASMLARIDAQAAEVLNNSTTPVTNNMPAQAPLVENAAMRHFRQWPILGAYVWPNAPGYDQRTTFNGVNGSSQPGELEHMKTWLASRLAWIDDQNFTGTVIYRPPVFSHTGGNVPDGTQLTISRYTGTPPAGYTYASGGTIYYTLDGTDPAGALTETTLISGNSNACKWLVPTVANGGNALTAGAGAQQWTNYTAPPNIANWSTGVTGVGYERSPGDPVNYTALIGAGSNTESRMYGINGTCYLRVEFDIPSQAALDSILGLKLEMKYDDGFHAYVNGTSVGGRNDTHSSFTTTPYSAVASTTHDDNVAIVYESFDITTLGKPALRVGTNVLAIHGLNGANTTSSDFLIIPRLTYTASVGNSLAYSAPIALNTSGTVRARLYSGGVWSPMTSAEFVVNATPASAANLVISELLYDPTQANAAESAAGFGDNDFEYVELMNVSAGNVDLTGCAFTNGIAFDFDVADPATLTLPPGARIVVVANAAGFAARYGSIPGLRIAGVFSGSLSNSGETITLRAANNDIIASVTYGTGEPWPVAAAGPGYSLVLNNPAGAPAYSNGFAWRASAQIGGTPGNAAGPTFAGSPTGDTDSDGYCDYLEHATGSALNNPNSIHRPTIAVQAYTVASVTDYYLTFTYRRNAAADGVNYTVELTDNLTAWDSSAAAVTYVGTAQNGDGTATVTCRATQPFDSATCQQMRLRVSP